MGAGHLDFRVVRSIDGRVADLLQRAGTTGLHEPLTLAVAGAASAFANRPIGETVALTTRALAEFPQARPASDYSLEGQLAIALYLSEQFDLLAQRSSEWLSDARRRGSLPPVHLHGDDTVDRRLPRRCARRRRG